jgi:hypothetical protein
MRAHLNQFLVDSGVQGTEGAADRASAIAAISSVMLQAEPAPVRLPWKGLRGVRALAERIAGLMGPCVEWRESSAQTAAEHSIVFQWSDARKLYTLSGSNMWKGWTLCAETELEPRACRRTLPVPPKI